MRESLREYFRIFSLEKRAARTLLILIIFALACLLTGTLPGLGAQEPENAAGAGKKFVAYTLVTRSYFNGPATAKNQEPVTDITARRADGEIAHRVEGAGENSPAGRYPVHIVRMPDGSSFEIYDAIRGMVAWPPRGAKEMAALANRSAPRDANCVIAGEYLAGRTTMDGVDVTIVKSLPQGSSGNTYWYAPKLDCQLLQQEFSETEANGKVSVVSGSRLVSLKLGEPDAELFDVPKHYALLMPSQAMSEMAKLTGKPLSAEMKKQAQEEDMEFFRRASAEKKMPQQQ